MGGGDTFHLIPVEARVYERWVNVELAEDLAVTEVAWSLLWDPIAEALFGETGRLDYRAPVLRPLGEVGLEP